MNCQFSSPRPPNTTSTTSGSRNCLMLETSTNSHDSGCSRRSFPVGSAASGAGCSGFVVIVLDPAGEVVAQSLGVAGVQARHGDRVLPGAGSVDEQGGQVEAALQRPAADVQVLHPRGRHPGLAAPHAAA